MTTPSDPSHTDEITVVSDVTVDVVVAVDVAVAVAVLVTVAVAVTVAVTVTSGTYRVTNKLDKVTVVIPEHQTGYVTEDPQSAK